jgi:hypothetical protein
MVDAPSAYPLAWPVGRPRTVAHKRSGGSFSTKGRRVAQNIAAIADHIDAMRRMERYGVATMTQMFTGFLALPAPLVVDDWRAALGDPKTLAEAESAFRERMKQVHPDTPGGSNAKAAALNAAIARAREELR